MDATTPHQGRVRTAEQVDAYRQLLEGKPSRRGGFLTGGVLGLAAVSLAGWAIRSSAKKRKEGAAEEAPASPDAIGPDK